MNEICQLANGIVQLRYLVFSLTGFLGFVTIAGAYFYLGPVKSIIHQSIGLINSVFGLIGAGIIGGLFFISKLIC